jgi:hypothetical protein
MTRTLFCFGLAAVVMAALWLIQAPLSHGTQAKPEPADAELQAEIKRLQELTPDQAAVMSHLAYHFSNLWFAVDRENWPLADFYLSETRSNLKWAVRAKPIRKDSAGKDVDLRPIAESIDNGPLTDLKKAIAAKDRPHCVKLYRDTLTLCYACHKASEKPYLRPQVPTAPEVQIINFDPKATWPE